jgi:hypothetical protein
MWRPLVVCLTLYVTARIRKTIILFLVVSVAIECAPENPISAQKHTVLTGQGESPARRGWRGVMTGTGAWLACHR